MGRSKSEKSDSFGEIVLTIVYALLIALAFRIILFQPFSIPSSSMKSTLLIGDYLFVSKYAYGYSRHSIPFSPPLFEGRLFGSIPEQGDVVVFKNRKDGNKDYIKRVIGLPGDRVQMIRGVLHLNGAAVAMNKMEDFVEPIAGSGSQVCLRREVQAGQPVCVKERFLETLPNGASHEILNGNGNRGGMDDTREFLVPPGHYFMMGDNRDNSGDSRGFKVGFVPHEDLIGRAEIIFLSSKGSAFLPWEWRFERLLDSID